jgi:hypothetical protein
MLLCAIEVWPASSSNEPTFCECMCVDFASLPRQRQYQATVAVNQSFFICAAPVVTSRWCVCDKSLLEFS